MSVLRLSSTSRVVTPKAAGLRAVGAVRSKSRAAMLIKVVLVGFVAIQVLKLVLDITVSQSAYELRNLKLEKIALTTQSEIIAQQVDSLSSQQNLANSAASLGMIANANPVFLRIADQKVFGKPKSALNTAGRVAKNNIASAALIQESVLTPAVAEVPISANVAKTVVAPKQVTLPASIIPVSPTH